MNLSPTSSYSWKGTQKWSYTVIINEIHSQALWFIFNSRKFSWNCLWFDRDLHSTSQKIAISLTKQFPDKRRHNQIQMLNIIQFSAWKKTTRRPSSWDVLSFIWFKFLSSHKAYVLHDSKGIIRQLINVLFTWTRSTLASHHQIHRSCYLFNLVKNRLSKSVPAY